MTLDQKKDELGHLLQTAMRLEWSTIPPYMVALLSIRKEANRVVANVIRSVMMEEMLHMVMVGNLMSSIDRPVQLGAEDRPEYPLRLKFEGKEFADRKFDINLAAFSKSTIDTFLQIELPASLLTPQLALADAIVVPGVTIGVFYQRIIDDLESLCKEFTEERVFTGERRRQIGEQYYWSGEGKPIEIVDLESARRALDVVIHQGEGATDSINAEDATYFDDIGSVAHYFRFKEIAVGRFYRKDDKPQNPPSGETFPVDYTAVYPIKSNPRQTDYAEGSRLSVLNQEFNEQYSRMVGQLETAFNGTPFALYDAIIDGMRVLAPIAVEMMSTPIDNDPQGRHGAPSFEWVEPPFQS
jgi:hypothetical protein